MALYIAAGTVILFSCQTAAASIWPGHIWATSFGGAFAWQFCVRSLEWLFKSGYPQR